MSKSLDANIKKDLEISQGIMGVPYNKLMNINNAMDTNVVSIIILIVKNDFSHNYKQDIKTFWIWTIGTNYVLHFNDKSSNKMLEDDKKNYE